MKDTLKLIDISPDILKVLSITKAPSEAFVSRKRMIIEEVRFRGKVSLLADDGVILTSSIDSTIVESMEKASNGKNNSN